jgi:hypothetical protein
MKSHFNIERCKDNSGRTVGHFIEVFNGHKNSMTPRVEAYYRLPAYFVELSSGKAIWPEIHEDGRMYGVTVISRHPLKHLVDLCQAFNSRSEAEAYIEKLAKGGTDEI